MDSFKMQILGAQVINSLALGSTYAILVVGFNLLLLVGGVFQYAYPHLVVVSIYMCWVVMEATGGNIYLSVLAAIGASLVLNIATEPIFRPLVKRGAALHTFVLSLGIAIICMDLMTRLIHTGRPIQFPPEFSGLEAVARIGLMTINRGQILTITGSVAAMLLFAYMLYRTRQGRAFRAIAQTLFAARILGIPIFRQRMLSHVFAGVLGGISAVFIAMTLGAAWSALADILALKVLVAVLLAGFGNLGGGLIAAYIIGMIEGMSLAYLPGDYTNAIVFGIVMVIVIIKPKGLFGLRA
jgi:branched-chain amino acid transport system permease protein